MSGKHDRWSWRARPLRFFIGVLLLALAAAATERLVAGLRTRFLETGNGACWMWAAGDYGDGRPLAFYAARDLWLDLPDQPARIAIVADETYLLYVNGRRVGAGSYRPGAPVDEYDVSHLLQVGVNRLLVELRSSRGAGGLLAELAIGSGNDPRLVVTDDEWRIFRRHDPGLLGGWSALEGGEAPQVWQRSPTGRWRLGETRRRRPIPFEEASAPDRRAPLAFQLLNSDSWQELDWSRRRIPAIGPQQIYDFGEEVEGILSFDLTAATGRPGLLYFDFEPPDPRGRRPDEVILPVPGRRYWEDAFPRRFRYVLVVGVEPYSRMQVDLLPPDLARELALPEGNHDGVFGVEPPRSYSKTEEDVWNGLGKREDHSTGLTGSNGST
ncbi:MAG: hypothetical protein GY719_20795 [bacterium]|nr:hypothetical protein [bacterium]